MKPTEPHSVELLSPARDHNTAIAAIDWGADAVYMGGPSMGARSAACNSIEQIARTVDYAHRFGVRVYVTLNTIVFDEELDAARSLAEQIALAGADALIVQDMAYTRMGLSGIELHASTQMFNASVDDVRFLEECGFAKVVLERNLTFEQIKAIRAATTVELECFVHGAICVCHSGRCSMSRSMSLRSGNRGNCMQACRLPYDLTDGNGRKVCRNTYLLSTGDLNLSQHIGELIDAGIGSFKIEGRLKDADYVRTATGCYRKIIDRHLEQSGGRYVRSSFGESTMDVEPDLEKCFARQSTEYFFGGTRGGVATLVTPKSRGEYIGRVIDRRKGLVRTDGTKRVVTGDGINFVSNGELKGSFVNRCEGEWFGCDQTIETGSEIYRNADHNYAAALKQSRTRRLLEVDAHLRFDRQSATLTLDDRHSHTAQAHCTLSGEQARDPEAAKENCRRQTIKTGGTSFRIGQCTIECNGAMPLVATAAINALRREAVERLESALSASVPQRRPFVENRAARLPHPTAGAEYNIANHLAREFYHDHGAETIDTGIDLTAIEAGTVVMTTPYCIRREIGECLREGSQLKDPLTIVNGGRSFELSFDCKSCIMKVIKR